MQKCARKLIITSDATFQINGVHLANWGFQNIRLRFVFFNQIYWNIFVFVFFFWFSIFNSDVRAYTFIIVTYICSVANLWPINLSLSRFMTTAITIVGEEETLHWEEVPRHNVCNWYSVVYVMETINVALYYCFMIYINYSYVRMILYDFSIAIECHVTMQLWMGIRLMRKKCVFYEIKSVK